MPLQDLYQTLLTFAQKQQQALVANDLERFFELQAARDLHFDKIRQVAPQVAAAPEAERQVLRGIVQQILKIDDDLEGDLTFRQESARGEIGKLQTGIQALHAYVQEGYTGAYFVDRNF